MSSDDDKNNDRTESMGHSDHQPDRPLIEKLGQFKIESVLGSGGMGTIYQAYDESMKRPVALKVLHTALEISSQAQSRFVREAWIAGQLDHPNIVKVYSRGEENNVNYIAMELIEGGSLYDYVKKTRESIPSGSDVTATIDQDYINDILGKFIELSQALEHIHSKGFIHRDIKPHNILLSGAKKKFKLTDFGIAHADDMTRMTSAGDFIGTIKYMSPELLAAHRAGIDKRTDIYSLGVSLYETLTLSLPFKADSEEKLIGEILAGHYNDARKSNHRIPVDLETVLMKACHHDPSLRYQTAVAFGNDLQRIIDGHPILAKRPSIFTKGYKYLRRNFKTVMGFSAAVIVISSALFWSYYQVKEARRIGSGDSSPPVAGSEPKFTKIDVPGLTEYCALSPNGERIAFVAEDSCLWVAPTHGRIDPTVAGEPVRLTEPIIRFKDVSYPTWSADGKWIAFNGKGVRDTVGNYWMSMFVIRSTGSDLNELSVQQKASKEWSDFRISLSPEGKQIFFSSDSSLIPNDPTSKCIYAMTVKSGMITRLTESMCGQVACSPNGKMLSYVEGNPSPGKQLRSGKTSNIWVIPVTGGTPIKINDKPGLYVSPIWSPNSRMIAFSKWKSHINVYAESYYQKLYVTNLSEDYYPVDPEAVVELPHSATDYICGWSANNKIGLVMKTDPGGGIYTIPSTGGVATQIASSHYYAPRWSPDEETIYILGDSAIYSLPNKGGSPKVVPISGFLEVSYAFCDISPDGARLVFAGLKAQDSHVSLYVVPVNGGEPIPLVRDSMHAYNPSWSPDGKWMAFSKQGFIRNGKEWIEKLCIIPSKGGEMRVLVDSKQGDSCSYLDSQTDWSPDGKFIAYQSYNPLGPDSLGGISIISVEDGQTELLVEFKPGYFSRFVGWSPDGKNIAYCSYNIESSTDGNIWVIPLESRNPIKLQTGLSLEEIWTVEWSPSGDRIAFTCHWPPERDFYLIENFLPSVQPEIPTAPESKEFSTRMVWSSDYIYTEDLERLSRHGRFVSLSHRWLGDLSILDLASKEIERLTDNQSIWDVLDTMPEQDRPAYEDSLMRFTGLDWGSVWSPDGNQLAYAWMPWYGDEPGDLCLIDRDGANQRTLVSGEDGVARYIVPYDWSGDGEHILATGWDGSHAEADNVALMSLSTIDGSAQVIDSIAVSPSEFKGAYYSPDNSYLAYTSADFDIFLLPTDGKSLRPLIKHPARDYFLAWSADGQWVCFASDRSGNVDIWVTRVADGKPQGDPSRVARNVGEVVPLGITQYGSMYYGLDSWVTDVYIAEIDPQAGKLLSSPERVTQRFEGTNLWPDWSPEGEYLLYRSGREGRNKFGTASPLCELELETGAERELFVQLKSFRAHHYSLDGQSIVVGGVDKNDRNGLFQVDLETGSAVLLKECAGGAVIRWVVLSPEGDRLFYELSDASGEQPIRLMQYDMHTRQERELLRENSWPVCPSLSPDGNWLSLVTFDSERQARCLNVMPADGGLLRQIVRFEEYEIIQTSDWMPDGKSILYVKKLPGQLPGHQKHRELWQVHVEGGSQRMIGLINDNATHLRIHPDGWRIAFGDYKLQTEIWVMENFLPKD